MLRETARYAVARWVPGAVNFLALALFTRLLTKEAYGTYALIIAWVALINAIGFQWLRSGVRRFLIFYRGDRQAFLATVCRTFLVLALSLGVVGVICAYMVPDISTRSLVLVGLGLLVCQAWVELNLDMILAEVQPWRYGAVMLARAVLSLICGVALATAGFGAFGVLAGVSIGYLGVGIWTTLAQWREVAPAEALPAMQTQLLSYGLPMVLTFSLDFIVNSSDRLLLGALVGRDAVGGYAAAYDLAQQGMAALMMTVNLGAFPMAVRALELDGLTQAAEQLRRHATVLFGLALPAAIALALLAPNVAYVVLGPSFRGAAQALIPIIAIAALLGGLKAYYFDLAFQLGRATLRQVWASAGAAVCNVALNLVLIPRYGAVGAAWSTLAAFGLGLLLSMGLGRRELRLPIPVREWAGIGLGTCLMSLALLPIRHLRGPVALLAQCAAGLVVFGGVLLTVDVGESRRWLARLLGRRAPAGGA